MPYRNKQMLRDANGDLIPQYWDVVEQEFKPLTGSGGANDVRLTGSNVADQVFEGTIPSGGYVEIDINLVCPYFRLIIYSGQFPLEDITTDVFYTWRSVRNWSLGSLSRFMNESTEKYRISDKTESESSNVRIRLYNRGEFESAIRVDVLQTIS